MSTNLQLCGSITETRLTYTDLINDLASGCKPKNKWKIGVELEQFAFNVQTHAALPYEGKPGIRMFLKHLAENYNWQIVTENSLPIALRKNGISITLEPGGQIEYSGSPVSSVMESVGELDGFLEELYAAAYDCGIDFLNTGLHPTWSREDIHWMPKGRYIIMREYMQKKGQHGLDMMMRSCGTQLNLDFQSEEDMVKKFRVCLALQPFIVALMTSSSMLDGKDTGYVSNRSFVWTDTDPDRCGGVPFVFEDDMSFEKYVDYALDVPMYFVLRDGQYMDTAGLSFRDFMDGKLPGFEGQYPTLSDWHDHISTLFPEVRLKHYLELRAADSNTPDMVHAMTAFWIGALYNQNTLDTLHDLVMSWPETTYDILTQHTRQYGLDDHADLVFKPRDMTEKILKIAKDGLPSEQEKALLQPFFEKLSQEG